MNLKKEIKRIDTIIDSLEFILQLQERCISTQPLQHLIMKHLKTKYKLQPDEIDGLFAPDTQYLLQLYKQAEKE